MKKKIIDDSVSSILTDPPQPQYLNLTEPPTFFNLNKLRLKRITFSLEAPFPSFNYIPFIFWFEVNTRYITHAWPEASGSTRQLFASRIQFQFSFAKCTAPLYRSTFVSSFPTFIVRNEASFFICSIRIRRWFADFPSHSRSWIMQPKRTRPENVLPVLADDRVCGDDERSSRKRGGFRKKMFMPLGA